MQGMKPLAAETKNFEYRVENFFEALFRFPFGYQNAKTKNKAEHFSIW